MPDARTTTVNRWGGQVTAEQATALQDTAAPTEGVRGVSGLPMVAGLVRGYEHHSQLAAPRRRMADYRKMLRTSPSLMASTLLVRAWVLSIGLRVERGPSTSEEAAAHLEEAFGLGPFAGAGRCHQSVDELLGGFFWARPYGFALMSEETVAEDGRYWLRGLHYRQPATISAWLVDPSGGFAGAVQQLFTPINGEYTHVLPANESVLLTHLPEEGGFEGLGLFRACHPHWKAQQDAYRQESVARQRYATPSPVAKFNPEVARQFGIVDRAAVQTEVDRFDEVLERYVGHERARLIIPPWFELDYYGGKRAYDPDPLLKSARHHERVMAEVFFAAHMQLGREGSGGTYNLGSMQDQVAYEANRNFIEAIMSALNKGPVTRNLAYNFGDRLKPTERPWLTFQGLRKQGFVERAGDIVSAASAGLFTPTDADERAFRDAYDLPPLPDDAARTVFDRTRQRPETTEAGQRGRRQRTPAASLVTRPGAPT